MANNLLGSLAKSLLAVSCSLMLLASGASATSPLALGSPPAYEADELIVMPKQGVSGDQLHQALISAEVRAVENVSGPMHSFIKVRTLPGHLQNAYVQLWQSGKFDLVQPNYRLVLRSAGGSEPVIPNDPQFPSQWNLKVTHLPETLALFPLTGGTDSATVLVTIDTGDRDRGVETGDKVDPGYDATSTNPGANATADPFGHGTKVGRVGAAVTNNRFGIAAFHRGKIFPINIYNNKVTEWYLVKALNRLEQFLVNHPKKRIVVSISAGIDGPYDLTNSAAHPMVAVLSAELVNMQRALLFQAAGNSGNLCPIANAQHSILRVASINEKLERSPFSNGAADFVAGGETVPTRLEGQALFVSGTCYSAVTVASIAGMLWTSNRGASATQVLSAMRSTCRRLDKLSQHQQGAGLPQADLAFKQLNASP